MLGGSAEEGSSIVFTIVRTGTAAGSTGISYATADGSAAAGADYIPASGTLTFTAAQTSQTVSVATIADSPAEPAETVLMTLSAPTGGATVSPGAGQATGTINANGAAPVFSISGGQADEGSTLVFTIVKSGTTGASLDVSYSTSGGSATAGSDYGATSGTLTFSPSQTSQTVTVPTFVDDSAEATETVVMALSSATGGATVSASEGQATGTINASSANTPPAAANDSYSVDRCVGASFDILGNDTDLDGDLPLTIIALAGSAVQQGYATFSSSAVVWTEVGVPGAYGMTYTVRDSRGATSTGSVTVTVTGSTVRDCNQ